MASTYPPFPLELSFGSFLVYPNREAVSAAANQSQANATRNLILAMKQDLVSRDQSPKTLIEVWIERLAAGIAATELGELFRSSPILVPLPRSSPLYQGSVWPARSIAAALVANGLGASVMPLVQRTKAIRKSAFAGPGLRPTAREHYDTMGVQGILTVQSQGLLLVDDVLTQGSTSSGAYARIRETYRTSNIVGVFAMARTVGTFERPADPMSGQIRCAQDGLSCSRYP